RSPSASLQRAQSKDSVISTDDDRTLDHRQSSKLQPTSKKYLTHAQVGCALNGCDSPLGIKHHFEVFSQWCHSAHLLPFVRRCYRRCGIAGLAAGQHVGRHTKGANPFYPLVLPTVPTVCYGHCYPLHKVFQYFYAGTETILCSVDDSKAVEADKASWGMVAGQDRLNNQCWFKVNDDHHDMHREEPPEMTRELTRDASKSSTRPSGLSRGTVILKPGLVGKSDEERKQQLRRKQQLAMRRQQVPKGPGALTAADPFFWFCHGDFYLYTFPANQVPRTFLQDPAAVTCRYADFVSRSGTPVRRPETASQITAEANADAPPSSCLCQPTDMTDHLRKRWQVSIVHPDEHKLLLGDRGWFPGALGHRFIFEASTQNVERYVLLDTMPQASLVYMQHVIRQEKKGQKPGKKAAAGQQEEKRQLGSESSEEAESSEEEPADPIVALHRRRLPYFYKKKKPAKKQQPEEKLRWETVDYMLPPLGPGS
ncbi:unnamed protein product, partial [Effrenium voratum]